MIHWIRATREFDAISRCVYGSTHKVAIFVVLEITSQLPDLLIDAVIEDIPSRLLRG